MVVEGNLPDDKTEQHESVEHKDEMPRDEQHEPATASDSITPGINGTQHTDEPIPEEEQTDRPNPHTQVEEDTSGYPFIPDDSVGALSDKSYEQIQKEVQALLGINADMPVLLPGRPILSPEDEERINKYRKFQKVDGAAYRRVNQFLRKHTYVTAREWAIARLCADFTTRGGAEMTFIGENLPNLVPFMTDTYSPQAVNQARSSFKRKVRKSGATFFYGALCGFFTADELDDILFESSEVARFLLEVEGTSIDIDDEIDVEDRITEVMREVAEAASMIRNREPAGTDEETEQIDTTPKNGDKS